MIFVVSTGRSGTQSLTALLDSLPGHRCLHEPAPALVRESASWRSGEMTTEEVASLLRETRSPTVDGDVYCESNQTISLIIPVAAEVFPEARFIWLVRSGLDVVASAYQKQWYSGHSENHDRYEDCPPVEKEWIDWRVRADRVGDMGSADWEALSRFGKCCWYWGYVNRVIGSDLAGIAAGRTFFLRLETLQDHLPDLVRWTGGEWEGDVEAPRRNKALRVPYHWSGWSGEEKGLFDRFCGDVMDRHYPTWRGAVDAEGALFAATALSGLQSKAREDSEKIISLRGHLKAQIERSERLRSRLDWIMSAPSWKLSAPLRKLEELVRGRWEENDRE
jgi:hypothetical protein